MHEVLDDVGSFNGSYWDCFGNLENLSMMVNRYFAPELDLGRGPTISMMICSNGSPTEGMGTRGAFGML